MQLDGVRADELRVNDPEPHAATRSEVLARYGVEDRRYLSGDVVNHRLNEDFKDASAGEPHAQCVIIADAVPLQGCLAG